MPQKRFKQYVGIDIGKDGAIVVLNTKNNEVISVNTFVTPLIGRELDFKAFKDLLLNYSNPFVVCEDLHAIFNSSAANTFTFGGMCYATEMACVCLEIPYVKVQAKLWQKIMFEGVKEIRKPGTKNKKGIDVKGKVDTKAMALIAAKRLFPKENFLPTPKSRTPHDGIVDAILMAEYARRTYK